MLSLIFVLAFAGLPAHGKINPSRVKSCLASLYTVQKNFHEEHKYYSKALKDMSGNLEACNSFTNIDFEVVTKDSFRISILDDKSNKLGSVDSSKEMTIY